MNSYENLLNVLLTSKQANERTEAYKKLNHDMKISLREIAAKLGTYTNKVRREFKKLGIESLDKSEIQTELLRSGKVKHPTEGKELTDSTKEKISSKIAKSWEDHPERREIIGEKAKERWEKMSPAERASSLSKASDAIRESAKDGSRLEKYLKKGLYEAGYVSIAHKVGVLPKQKLEFDLYINELGLIIEVDGPSHFKPIWGQKTLEKNKERDKQKAGVALSYGMKLIRVKQTKNFSQFYFKHLLDELVKLVDDIKNKRKSENYFEIE
jgi:very-short-patch-repair endonuclease